MLSHKHLNHHLLHTTHLPSKNSITYAYDGGQKSRGEQTSQFDRALHCYVNLGDLSRVAALLVGVRLANT